MLDRPTGPPAAATAAVPAQDVPTQIEQIGQNDTSGEIFTLADAATVESYAAQQGIAMLSLWSEGRDNGGCPSGGVSPTCSGISQTQFEFTSIFAGF